MPPLSSFPFLSPSEFRAACSTLADWFHSTRSRSGSFQIDTGPTALHGWNDVRVVETPGERDGEAFLVISRFILVGEPASASGAANASEDEIEADDDSEALVRETSRHKLNVEYNILLSPTYQVPVLYFALRNVGGQTGPEGLDMIYEHLVPSQFKSSLRQVGVLGGISVGNHPISDVPTHFVHPCNTADALRDVVGSEGEPTTETYLLLWLGLVGGCVNLHVPSQMFAGTGDR